MGIACHLYGNSNLVSVFDLGASPPCESFLPEEQLDQPEVTYPLHLRLCPDCLLLQVPALITPEEIFGGDYVYYFSCSVSWVEHTRRFVDQAVESLGFGPDGFIVEVTANDGYLLQHVVNRGIRCLGIGPSLNCSEAIRGKGIPILRAFLDEALVARVCDEHGPADPVVVNNVLAHISGIIGFVSGLWGLVADTGRVSIKVRHALSLIIAVQFDTVYHEHFQYWTVLAARHGLAVGGLGLVDVELLSTHGGSIRLWAVPGESDVTKSSRVVRTEAVERAAGLGCPEGCLGLAWRAARIRDDLVAFLTEARRAGRRVVAYGAPGKGGTLLNYCSICPDLLAYATDHNTFRHGRYTPGTRIPMVSPEHLVEDYLDDVLVLPWDLREEITAQLVTALRAGTRFTWPLPELGVEILGKQ